MADANAPAADQQPSQNAQAGTEDLYRKYHFKLIIDGVTKGHFTRVDGMGIDIGHIEYCEGGESQNVRQLVGRTAYTPVTLWYGLIKADSEPLFKWILDAAAGAVTPKNVSVVHLGPGGRGEKARYNLNVAWPISWRGAELDALGRDIAVEQMTLVYESLTRL